MTCAEILSYSGKLARIVKIHHSLFCDTHLNYEPGSFWEHRTPAAAMLVLCPARWAISVRWWLFGVASQQLYPLGESPGYRAAQPGYRAGVRTPEIKI